MREAGRRMELDLGARGSPQVTVVMRNCSEITEKAAKVRHTPLWEGVFSVPGLDYISCFLTISSTILVGRRCWEGWALAAINSVIICIIGLRTQQFGFIPANVFCLVLCGKNVRAWRRVES